MKSERGDINDRPVPRTLLVLWARPYATFADPIDALCTALPTSNNRGLLRSDSVASLWKDHSGT